MIVFLFIISATVIGVFLYVITLQKHTYLVYLKHKALPTAIQQKWFCSNFHIIFNWNNHRISLNTINRYILPPVVPIHFNLLTMLIYGIVLIIISLLGSLFSVLSIIKINPLKAIGQKGIINMLEFKQVSKSFRDGNQMIQAVKPTDLKIIQGN